MNTATISSRPSTSAEWPSEVERETDFTPYDYEAPAKEEPGTEIPAAFRFEHEVATFQRAIGRERDARRSAIIKRIISADCPDEYIDAVLQTLLTSSQPGRLDDAVDILSQTGGVLPQFMYESLSRKQSANVREDYWHVLIRALGKCSLPAATARMFVQLFLPKSPEAAIEALGDIGDEKSLKVVRAYATDGPSEFIRELAAEIVEECSD